MATPPLDPTLSELEKYAEHTKSPKEKAPRPILKLVTEGDKTELRCVSTRWDRFKHALGFGNYRLDNITAFLSSRQFLDSIQPNELTVKDVASLEKAVQKLSGNITSHNKKTGFFRKEIQTRLLSEFKGKLPHTKAKEAIEKVKQARKLPRVEQRLMAALKPDFSPTDILTAQIDAIGKLCLPDSNDEKKIKEATDKAFFIACGILETDIPGWIEARDALEKAWMAADKLLPEIEPENPPQGQKLVHEKMQYQLHEMIKAGVEEMVDSHIKSLNPKQLSEQLPKWLKEVSQLERRTKLHVENCKTKTMQPRYDFFEKWGKNLKAEMVQSYKDTGDDPICWGLTLRWTADELNSQNKPDVKDMIATMKVGKSRKRDRFAQAFYKVAKRVQSAPQLHNIKKRYSIRETRTLNWSKEVEGKEAIQQMLAKNLASDDFRKANKGIGQLGFWWANSGHAITIRCQPDQEVFRFTDPNYGTFDFETFDDFVNCLTELLHTFYSPNFKEFTCYCYELGDSKKSL